MIELRAPRILALLFLVVCACRSGELRGRQSNVASIDSIAAELTASSLLRTSIEYRAADDLPIRRTVDWADGNLLDLEYARSPSGRVLSKVASPPSIRTSYYGYDGWGRVNCVAAALSDCPTPGDSNPPSSLREFASYWGELRSGLTQNDPIGNGTSTNSYNYSGGGQIGSIGSIGDLCPDGSTNCSATISYSYDENGGRMSEGDSRFPVPGDLPQREFRYAPDHRIRAIRVQVPETPTWPDCTSVTYHSRDRVLLHGASGQLVASKVVEGSSVGQENVFHLPNGEIAYRVRRPLGGGAGERVTQKYLYLEGERVAEVKERWIDGIRASREYLFLHNDNQRAPVMATKTESLGGVGTKVWEGDRDVWGWTHASTSLADDELPFEYPGQTRLAGTEVRAYVPRDGVCASVTLRPAIVENWYREYDPWTGQYLTPDPLDAVDPSSNAGSELGRYMYVNGDPLNRIDPLGLYDWMEFTLDTLNFTAGLGNAASFGASTWIAKQFMDSDDAAVLDKAKHCAGYFKVGQWASLGLGAGRLMYAGVAKVAAADAADAAAAVAFRNGLKRIARGPLAFSAYRIMTYEELLAKYGSDAAVQAAAGRTNVALNIFGADMAVGGLTRVVTDLVTASSCGCE